MSVVPAHTAVARRAVHILTVAVATATALGSTPHAQAQTDPLPSWNDGPAKQAIVRFVQETTDKSNPKFVPPAKRVATFDQDGTLWVEHPVYTQVTYCLERVPEVVKAKPQLKNVEPFKTVLSGDREAMAKLSRKDLETILAATLSGMSIKEFRTQVDAWLAKANHPRWNKPYMALIYQPMLEVMKYLRANGYKTYIVTGGGQDFVRVYSDRVYGIPRERVVGSVGGTKYGYDKAGKPGPDEGAQGPVDRRRTRQAGRHQHGDRAASRRRVRQLGRRSPDAGVHWCRRRRAPGDARVPRRRGARVRLRAGAGAAEHEGRDLFPGAL